MEEGNNNLNNQTNKQINGAEILNFNNKNSSNETNSSVTNAEKTDLSEMNSNMNSNINKSVPTINENIVNQQINKSNNEKINLANSNVLESNKSIIENKNIINNPQANGEATNTKPSPVILNNGLQNNNVNVEATPANNTNVQIQSTATNNPQQPNANQNVNNINNTNNIQPNIQTSTNIEANNQVNDEDLIKAFIGEKYEKLTKKRFNFASFFFSTFNMFYRKMYGYGVLVFLLTYIASSIIINITNNMLINIAFIILIRSIIGFSTNKIYLSNVKKKVAIIKVNNPQKSIEELKSICAKKGGTSVGTIFLGFFTEAVIVVISIIIIIISGIGSAFGKIFDFSDWNININNPSDKSNEKDKILAENVTVIGSMCFGSKCSVTIADSTSNETDYNLEVNNNKLFTELCNYNDYIKLNIYYTKSGDKKSIVDYKLFLKSNNEDISSVKTIDELIEKIGLYTLGLHTDNLTLTKIDAPGFKYDGNKTYTYETYVFTNSKNIELKMKYISDDKDSNYIIGNKYNVTFEVKEGTFEYEYLIKTIK